MSSEACGCHNDKEVENISKSDRTPILKNLREHFRNLRTRDWNGVLAIILCFYAVLKEIKVGEPYMYKYQHEYLNLTEEQLTAEIYPFIPYTYIIVLIPIFIFTDILLYHPTMLMEVLGQIGFRSTLVFFDSVQSQILGIMSYAVAIASEVGFFSYIYAKLEKDQYRKLTGWTRAGTMAGRTFGYLFGQFLILFQLGTLRNLNEIALVIPCLVLVFCICLPRVHWKVMVGRMVEAKEKDQEIESHDNLSTKSLPTTYTQYVIYRLKKLRSDFIAIISVGPIRKWSFWWAMTTCMSLQVTLYAQTLWGEVQTEKSLLNGFAEAGYTAISALAILGMNSLSINWDKWGELVLVIISSIDAALLFLNSQTMSIYVMYFCYISYRCLYQVMITIAQWNIAKKMTCESYGLVFGANGFIALIMQTILTVVVSDKRGFGLPVRPQYIIYACCHLVIALIFLISVTITIISYLYNRSKNDIVSPQNSQSYREAQVR